MNQPPPEPPRPAAANAPASPFHIGEQRVQSRLGVRDIEHWARRMVQPVMAQPHRDFYSSLPFLVVGARDAAGRVWATLLTGEEGFVTSPDEGTLRIDTRPVVGDALAEALRDGADLGILGIELSNRRRNRVNGRVDTDEDGAIRFSVVQAFGNCPQYIRERQWRRVITTPGPVQRGAALTDAQRAAIEAADTLFIASGYRGEGQSPTYGMDASHRGGDPGFVRVYSPRRIVVPDYAGNNHFNTIGNLTLDPRVGVTFVDFAAGGMLQVSGRATIVWDGEALRAHPGARRLIAIEVESVVELPAALPLRWTGDGVTVRSLRLVDKTPESDDVTSFTFISRDGGPLPDFEAGQHLPLVLKWGDQTVTRTYSLSSAPGEDHYRISVKREPHGLVSRLLHDEVEVGAILSARAPAGAFVLTHGSRPVILVSAGVGVTPMVSMLRSLLNDPGGAARRVVFVHGARDGAHHALKNEVEALVARHPKAELHVAYSRPGRRDTGYHRPGRVDAAMLVPLVERVPDADYFLCGPVGFMADAAAALTDSGVDPTRIHSESFGPR